MGVIDDEDRVWKARVARAKDGWPFDAEKNDPLTAHRIPVACSHPSWCYLVSFDRESEERPTEHEVKLLVSYLNQYKDYWYGDGPYRRRMEARPLDVDGGANGVIFHKFGTDDWGWRRRSFEYGFLFTVVWPSMRDDEQYANHKWRGPLSLLQVMDQLHTHGSEAPTPWWVEWKAKHPEVFGEVSPNEQ